MIKKVSIKNLPVIPASHEDFSDPGVVKKVLLTAEEISPKKRMQMINWAKLLKGKSFRSHYHEDMDEIFIMVSGKVQLKTNKGSEILEKGDTVIIPMRHIHEMKNIGIVDADYIVIGLSLGKGGKTVNVDK